MRLHRSGLHPGEDDRLGETPPFERVGLLHVRMAGEQGIEAPVRVPLLVLQGGNDRVPHACHGLEGEAVGGDEPAGVDVGLKATARTRIPA